MTFTVIIKNTLLGTSHGVGKFATEADAIAFAGSEARRMRSFVEYEVWTGTPRDPRERTSTPTIKGEQ